MAGAIDVLKTTVEATAPRERMGDLYGAVLLAGCGGGLPGMRQRLDSELRQIRNDPSMPRAIRPRIVDVPSAASGSGSGVDMRSLHLGAHGGDANAAAGGKAKARGDGDGSAGGSGGVHGGVCTTGAGASAGGLSDEIKREALWALSEAETLAWRGAAEEALIRGRGGAQHGSTYSTREPGEWMVADQFRRNPLSATRAAFKAAGCVNMEAVVDRAANGMPTGVGADRWGANSGYSALRGGPMMRG